VDKSELNGRIREHLSRDLLIDLFDSVTSRALQAYELIRDNTDLNGRSARGLEGQARFRLMEKGFQDACERHGALRLGNDLIPDSDLRVFQPFMRFGGEGAGVILALASMPAASELPNKNRSREAGVTLNYRLTPRLDLGDMPTAQPGDLFVVLVAARDPARGGRLDEVAIGVIDGSYEAYLAYEPIERFLNGYGSVPPEPDNGGEPPLVKLKSDRKAFKAPEQSAEIIAPSGKAE